VSEYLLLLYRPIADAILREHKLVVDEEMRDAMAKTILLNRTLPVETATGSRSPMPTLGVAKTHTKALLKYASSASANPSSIEKRSSKLAAALRANELVGITLVLAKPSFDPSCLLRDLDAGKAKRGSLRRLLNTLEALPPWQIGRLWANFTPIVRCGCLAWLRAGRTIQSSWNMEEGTISGALPDFLFDLIDCCNGKHDLVGGMERIHRYRAPLGHPRLGSPRKGDKLKVSNMALRDAIRAYRKWFKAHEEKNPTLFFRQH